ncbi:MAG: hypothetical protein HYX75_03510 [Acidobacteria bacterium]|nr:hypothetical protein [Acidobacteriota bacterium]
MTRDPFGGFVLRLGVLVFGVSAGMSAGEVDLAVTEYQSRLGHEFEYRLSRHGDRVVRASGVLSDPVQGDRIEAARDFVCENKGMFGIDSDSVRRAQSRVLTSRNGIHVALTQVIGGVRVMGPASHVHYDEQRRIMLVQNNFLPGARPRTTPRLTRDEIGPEVKRAFSEDAAVTPGEAQLVLRREGDDLRLVYYVPTRVASTPPTDWMVFIDAIDPDVAPQRLEVLLAASAKGTIFPENPVTTSLQSLVFPNLLSPTRLSGSYVRTYNGKNELWLPESVENQRKFTTATESDRDFTYRGPGWPDPRGKPSHIRFAEAMAYYHVNRAHDTLKDMGFNELDEQMPVFLHTRTFYLPHYQPGDSTLGVFPRTGLLEIPAQWANDSDVYYHEYGHAALDHIQPLLRANVEHVYGRIYHEAWGDILAASLNRNSQIGEYAWVNDAVSLTDFRVYPTDVQDPVYKITDPHQASLIISGPYWYLYRQFGSKVLQWFLDANYLLDGSENMFGIRDAVIQASPEDYKQLIYNGFLNNGVLGPDPGNNAKVKILDVYPALPQSGTFEKRTRFRKFETIAVCVDAEIKDAAPAYRFYGKLSINDAQVFPSITQVTLPGLVEAGNGTRSQRSGGPYVLYFVLSDKDTPAGSYHLKIEGHLGGSALTFEKTFDVTIEP